MTGPIRKRQKKDSRQVDKTSGDITDGCAPDENLNGAREINSTEGSLNLNRVLEKTNVSVRTFKILNLLTS